MKVLVIGGGGREHAICRKLSEDERITKLYCAPGNAGTAYIAESVPLKATDITRIVAFAEDEKIDLVFVAPDDPLVLGLVDALEEHNIRAFGPNKRAAIIEGSKSFAKKLMEEGSIPTAKFETFHDCNRAIDYLKNQSFPIVIKADGLALGKGVIIANTYDEAADAVKNIMIDKKFGESGSCVVIEEFLQGVEVSILAFTDGNTLLPMLSSQDYKKALDSDEGLNTGGMGAFAPSPLYTESLHKECMDRIFIPTVEAMKKQNRKFKGVLYFGLMLTDSGPKVLEYNARFGDPETQAVLSLLETKLLDIVEAVINEKLSEIEIKWNSYSAVCVVAASGGYPLSYKKGFTIKGLDMIDDNDVFICHAGTAFDSSRNYITSGGRVFGVVAKAKDLPNARIKAYRNMEKISFENMYYRKDIADISS